MGATLSVSDALSGAAALEFHEQQKTNRKRKHEVIECVSSDPDDSDFIMKSEVESDSDSDLEVEPEPEPAPEPEPEPKRVKKTKAQTKNAKKKEKRAKRKEAEDPITDRKTEIGYCLQDLITSVMVLRHLFHKTRHDKEDLLDGVQSVWSFMRRYVNAVHYDYIPPDNDMIEINVGKILNHYENFTTIDAECGMCNMCVSELPLKRQAHDILFKVFRFLLDHALIDGIVFSDHVFTQFFDRKQFNEKLDFRLRELAGIHSGKKIRITEDLQQICGEKRTKEFKISDLPTLFFPDRFISSGTCDLRKRGESELRIMVRMPFYYKKLDDTDAYKRDPEAWYYRHWKADKNGQPDKEHIETNGDGPSEPVTNFTNADRRTKELNSDVIAEIEKTVLSNINYGNGGKMDGGNDILVRCAQKTDAHLKELRDKAREAERVAEEREKTEKTLAEKAAIVLFR